MTLEKSMGHASGYVQLGAGESSVLCGSQETPESRGIADSFPQTLPFFPLETGKGSCQEPQRKKEDEEGEVVV